MSQPRFCASCGVIDAAAVVDAINAISNPASRLEAISALRERVEGCRGDYGKRPVPYLFLREGGYLAAQQS